MYIKIKTEYDQWFKTHRVMYYAFDTKKLDYSDKAFVTLSKGGEFDRPTANLDTVLNENPEIMKVKMYDQINGLVRQGYEIDFIKSPDDW